METIPIKQVDAFTNEPFTGNPAAVVVDADNLSDEQMLKIANEMNLSETAYVLKSDKADLRIRWFAPESEILFCGHATVATMHVLAEENLFGMSSFGEYDFKVETMVGILDIKVSRTENGIKVFLDSPRINLKEVSVDMNELVSLFSISKSELNSELPVMKDGTMDYLLVPFKDLKSLSLAKYNDSVLQAFSDKHKIVGYSLFTAETHDKESHYSSRFFIPGCGVGEDPVTGSANGPLAVYLVKNKVYELDEANVDENAGLKAKLIGEAVTVLDGKVYLEGLNKEISEKLEIVQQR